MCVFMKGICQRHGHLQQQQQRGSDTNETNLICCSLNHLNSGQCGNLGSSLRFVALLDSISRLKKRQRERERDSYGGSGREM